MNSSDLLPASNKTLDKAVAVLKSGAKAARIPLAPEGGRLVGRAEAALGEHPSGAVRITAPDGTTANARFD